MVPWLNLAYSSTVEESWRLVIVDSRMKYCYGLSTKCPQSNLSLNAWSLVGGTVWRGGRQCFKAYLREDGHCEIFLKVICLSTAPVSSLYTSCLPKSHQTSSTTCFGWQETWSKHTEPNEHTSHFPRLWAWMTPSSLKLCGRYLMMKLPYSPRLPHSFHLHWKDIFLWFISFYWTGTSFIKSIISIIPLQLLDGTKWWLGSGWGEDKGI